jgi:hypothetical protein
MIDRTRVVTAACMGLLLSTLTIAGASGQGADATPSPDEQAANGPLVGDLSLIADEQSCIESNPNTPWYPTIAAFEVYDSARTHDYVCAHFGGSMTAPNDVFAYVSPDTYVTPYNIVGMGPDQLFIYGGGYGDDGASGSFVSAIEPGSLRERWRRVLINTNVTDEWDYPGVLNVLADGTLVVIYGYHIAKLDPATGDVLALTELPTGQAAPRDTAYNGYDALSDGTIIAKTVFRQAGCEEQGFSAFLDCPDSLDTPPSVLVAIDPGTLEVLAQLELPEMMGGRVTTSTYQGTDYIYLPGTSNLYRYTYADGAFAADDSWGPIPYVADGQTSGSAMAAMGDYVVTMTNGGAPTSVPMSVVVVSQADATDVQTIAPFADSGSRNSFIPSMVSVDPSANLIYVMDAGAGMIGAVELGDDGLSVLWSAEQTTLSFTTLVGPDGQKVLIGTDIPIRFFRQLQSYTTEQVVWRDAATGQELARSDQFPKMSPGILVTPGFGGLQYFLSLDGEIRSLQVAPVPPDPSASPDASPAASPSPSS